MDILEAQKVPQEAMLLRTLVGYLIESAVYAALRRRFGEKIFYWQGEGEIDFFVQEKNEITHVYQVVAENLDDGKVFSHEISALIEAKRHFPKATCALIAKTAPKKQDMPFPVLPLWQFLL